MTTPMIHSIRDILPQYDGFIIDLWGVMHNGGKVFPEALQAVQLLREQGKKVVFLSNAPRRSHIVAESLMPKGLTPDMYEGIITSGEVSYQALLRQEDDELKNLGSKCYFYGGDYHFPSFQDLPLTFQKNYENADFLLVAGNCSVDEGFAPVMPMLISAQKRDLLFICTNPDKTVVHLGEKILCPGAIADEYKKLGGRVRYFGKPDPLVFQRAMQTMGTTPTRTLVIGDGINTDIAGATASGAASLWVLGTGIAAQHLPAQITSFSDLAHLANGQTPTYLTMRLAA